LVEVSLRSHELEANAAQVGLSTCLRAAEAELGASALRAQEAEARAEEAERRAEEAERRLQAIEGSSTWRATEPLRRGRIDLKENVAERAAFPLRKHRQHRVPMAHVGEASKLRGQSRQPVPGKGWRRSL
jgi:hypothetical protein